MALTALLALTGCDGTHDHDDDGGHAHDAAHGPEVEACEHLDEGPSKSVLAAAEAGPDAPAVASDHHRWDVTFVPVDGGNGGTVTFAAAEAADYVLFLDRDVPVTVADAAGATIPPASSVAGSELCPGTLVRTLTHPLGVGLHTLTFGPVADVSAVGLVIEEAAHDDGAH